MPVKAKFARLPLLLVLVGCSGGPGGPVGSTPTAGRSSTPPEVQVIFREGRVFAREGEKEWPIAEVDRDQMLWSPDGLRFAYFKQDEPASRPTASAEPTPQDGGKVKADALPEQHAPTYRIVIRNIRGDSVNEFAVYRAGRPSDLDWIDNETLGYVAPPDGSGETYVLHSTRTSEILTIYRGTHFVWSPGRKQLAYITNPKRDQLVKVDSQVVWPRGAMELSPGRRTRGHRGPTRRIQGTPRWSPDGSGLAFLAIEDRKPRLVVLLVVNNPGGDLSWPLPHSALLPGNRLFWGDSKMVIGESMLKPRFAASWKRIH